MTRSAWITLFHNPGIVRPSPFAVIPAKRSALISPPRGMLIIPGDYSRGINPVFAPPEGLIVERSIEAHTDFDDPPDAATEKIRVFRSNHPDMDEVDAWQKVWVALDHARWLMRKAEAEENDCNKESLCEKAAASWRDVRDLVGPPSGDRVTPLARFLNDVSRGDVKLNDLQMEAVFEYALFTHPRELHEVLDDISILRTRIEERLKAIDGRIRELRSVRIAVEADSALPDSFDFTTKSIDKRLHMVRQRLDENALSRRVINDELGLLAYDRDMLVNARGDYERRRRDIGRRMEHYESTIRRVRSISPLYGIRELARRKRRLYRELAMESRQQLAALTHELESVSTACASVDERIELRLSEMHDLKSRSEKLFAERLALYAEEEALNAALGGDTSWIDVLRTHSAEQERALYKARIAESSALMRFAGHAERIIEEMASSQTGVVRRARRAFLQRSKYYEMAERTARSILNDLHTMSDNRHADIRLLAHMQLVESLARQSESALKRHDHGDLREVLGRLDAVVEGLALEVEDGSPRAISLAADHVYDVIILMTRMGMHDRARSYAYLLATLPVYVGTPAARAVRDLDVARSLMDEPGGFMHPSEKSFGTHWMQRAKAAFRHAVHNNRFAESMIIGGASMCAAFGAQYAIADSISPWLPACAAAGVTCSMRAINGWRSPSAVSAWRTGMHDGTVWETARDIARVGVRAGLGAAGWFIPSLMLSTVAEPQAQAAVAATLSNIFNVWGERVPSVIASSLIPLDRDILQSVSGGLDVIRLIGQYNPAMFGDILAQGYASWLAALGSEHAWVRRCSLGLPPLALAGGMLASGGGIDNLYRLYMAGAGLLYGAYMIKPSWRGRLRDIASYFIPGAVMLGADIGLSLRHEQPWSLDHLQRLGLGTAVLIEGAVMLLMTGTVPLPFMNTRREAGHVRGNAALSERKESVEFVRALARGMRYDANHMFMVAMAITVGISSALGGLILEGVHVRPTSSAMYALLGAMTGFALLPMPLLVSGILKQQIPIIPSIEESLEETKGKPFVRRVAGAFASGAYAFTAPYVWNRIWRVPTLDVPAAFVRTMIGWDSLGGYLPSMVINAVFANPTASMMRPETAGTPWQHDALTALLDKDVIDRDKLFNHWRRSAQQLSALHFMLFFGHRRDELKDWSYPLVGIRRIWDPPEFPLKRQVHYLAEFFLYVTGQTPEPNVITPTKLRMLLSEIREMTRDPSNHETVRPIIQVLYMARSPATEKISGVGRERALGHPLVLTDELRAIISTWFAEHPGIVDLMRLNTGELVDVTPGAKRKQRRAVRGAIKVSWRNYVSQINEFRGSTGPELTDGLFR